MYTLYIDVYRMTRSNAELIQPVPFIRRADRDSCSRNDSQVIKRKPVFDSIMTIRLDKFLFKYSFLVQF